MRKKENNLFEYLNSIDDESLFFNILISREIWNRVYNNLSATEFQILIKKVTIKQNKLILLKKLKKREEKIIVLKGLEDTYICEFINESTVDDYFKIKAISLLRSDRLKLKYFLSLKQQLDVSIIVESFNSIYLKLKHLKRLSLVDQLAVIKSLPDDFKMKYLYDDEYEEYFLDIISSFDNEEFIIIYFNEATLEDKKYLTLKTKNLNLKIRLFEKIQQEEVNSDIVFFSKLVNSVQNDKNRFEIIKKIKDENIRLLFLSNLETYKSSLVSNMPISIPKVEINPNITIGLEIEACNLEYDKFLDIKKVLCDWDIKEENTVTNGLEVTSPKMNYNEKSMRELNFVCELLKKLNFYITHECGAHIHIGFSIFKNSEQLQKFYEIFCACEEIFYYILNKKTEEVREYIYVVAKPISKEISIINNQNLNNVSLRDFVELIKKLQKGSRNYNINLMNAYSLLLNTIECRIPNGQISYEELMHNIILVAKLVDMSVKKLTEKEEKYYNALVTDELSLDEKFEILMKFLFDKNEDIKKFYQERYYENKCINNSKTFEYSIKGNIFKVKLNSK